MNSMTDGDGGSQRPSGSSCDVCRELGPLLTAPGTSGRDWHCEECGTVWPGAAVACQELFDLRGEIERLRDAFQSNVNQLARARADESAETRYVVYQAVVADLSDLLVRADQLVARARHDGRPA